jgi:hypothetical protein
MINPKKLSNDGDELDYFYYLLKDEQFAEKVAFPIFSNELFVWSQKNLFQQHECQRLLILARKEANLLVLPLAENMPIKNLALEYLTRYVVFKVFNNRGIREELLNHYRTYYYPSPFKDEGQVYNSLVYLMWQERKRDRYRDILIERLRSNPVAKRTFVLAAHTREKNFCITSADAVLASEKSFKFLLKRYLKRVKSRLPIDEKKSLIDLLLGRWVTQLAEMPFEKLCHEAFYTDRVIQTDFSDEWRREHTQGRYPEGGFEHLDAETINSDGRRISMIKVLEGEHESLQTQPLDIIYPFTASQKEALKEFLSNTEVKILETFYNYSDATQAEVAKHVGCTQSKISKAKRKFQRHEDKIKKILEIE